MNRKENQSSQATGSPPTLRQQVKAMYRDAVINAAEHVFSTSGIRGARIQDIAKQAGVSVGSVYNHFAQKEDILMALVAKHNLELKGAFDAQPGDPSDFLGAMRARHERVMQFMHQHIGFYSLALYDGVQESELVPPGSALCTAREATEKRVGDIICELLEQGMREGVVRQQSTSRLRHFYTGAVRGMLVAAARERNLDIVEEGRAALELFLRAICVDRFDSLCG